MNTDTTTTVSSEITIIGGSLAGLTLALACARRNVPVRIIERTTGHVHGGDSLSIDLDVVAATVGYDPRTQPVLPVVPAYRELTTWPALYAWLRGRVAATPGIVVEEGRAVASLMDLGDCARVTFADGSERIAAAVIGADGYRSVVRRAIAPEDPFARYAGYLVWRGLIEERALTHPVPWPSDGDCGSNSWKAIGWLQRRFPAATARWKPGDARSPSPGLTHIGTNCCAAPVA